MIKKINKKDIEYTKSILKIGNYITLINYDFWVNYNDNIFPYGVPLSNELKEYLKNKPFIKITKNNIYWLIGETYKFRQATKEEIIRYYIQMERYEFIHKLQVQELFNEGCGLITLDELQNPKKGDLIIKINSDGVWSTKKIDDDV